MTGLRCSRERATKALALYDARMSGGYKNQQIAARENVKRVSGLGVRDLRAWLAANPDEYGRAEAALDYTPRTLDQILDALTTT